MSGAYYNEFDPYAAQWLRNLIGAGLIAPGDVDERSIIDVHPDDLCGYTQCHFFAGIGGWAYALQLAEWPDDEPVWTGSPPCQPFSAAGQQRGADDERHLAPHWIDLVAACRPPVIFGEQVASAPVVGRDAKRAGAGAREAPEWAWLDDLSRRLESAHYAVGAADLPAAGVGAPHIRQRLWFVAERLADARRLAGERVAGGVSRAQAEGGRAGRGDGGGAVGYPDGGASGRLADAERDGREVAILDNGSGDAPSGQREADVGGGDSPSSDRTRPPDGFWRDADWLWCRDGKWRPVEPGTFPLAHGVPGRVGRLRAYGNAIAPQVAEQFIRAYREITEVPYVG